GGRSTAALEEQDAAGNTLATYVWGGDGSSPQEIWRKTRCGEEPSPPLFLLSMRRGGADYYYVADDLQNVLALTDAAGNVVERSDYQDFGQPAASRTGVPAVTPSFAVQSQDPSADSAF